MKRGFTLIELLVVIAIIGILTAIVVVSLEQSRIQGRDANRASQLQEFLKAMELYYTNGGSYPDDGVADGGVAPALIEGSLPGNALRASEYMKYIPADPRYDASLGYHYCASNDLGTMYLIINTERDRGGTDFCTISRGPRAYFSGICRLNGADVSTFDRCMSRM